jgi:hypothetical protein
VSAPRRSVPQWVRATSERHLMVVAQRRVALRYGTPPPPAARGVEIFWQKVYAPLFYTLPYPLRTRFAGLMPGSHRRTWHKPEEASGPAV